MDRYFALLHGSFDFKGTMSFRECWCALAVNNAIGFALMLFFALLKLRTWGLTALCLMLLPIPAAAVRRLRDAGKSPWLVFWALVPAAGVLILAGFMAATSSGGSAGRNE